MNLLCKIFKWCDSVFGQKPESYNDEEVVDLRSDLARCRLDLKEVQDALDQERTRVAAMESAYAGKITETVTARLSSLFSALAVTLSQLRTQRQLLEAGTPLGAADVMALAEQIEQELIENGLTAIGEPGAQLGYDPEKMSPLNAGASISLGSLVKIRFIGYQYAGTVIRKAFVDKVV